MRYLLLLSILLSGAGCRMKHTAPESGSSAYYTCSMHPQVMQPNPGQCPVCGMELIPVKKASAAETDRVVLSDQQVQLGNIHVDTIGSQDMGDKTVWAATLNVDESKSSAVAARVAGRIQKLYIKETGVYVHKGERLYDLYSEELNNARQEYLLALEKKRLLDNSLINVQQLVEGARNKLLLWGMTETQINELPGAGNAFPPITTFYSPAEGYVFSLEKHEGDYLAEGTTILRLADLSSLWAEARVYTTQLASLNPGGRAWVQLPDQPGKPVSGSIMLVQPDINPDTRIDIIRVVIPNAGGRLQPGMPAYVTLSNSPGRSLALPSEAVIRNAEHDMVWIQVAPDTYQSVIVETGLESAGRIEIKSGLKKGDLVVTVGVYLLNSEYIFRHGLNPAEKDHAAHRHI